MNDENKTIVKHSLASIRGMLDRLVVVADRETLTDEKVDSILGLCIESAKTMDKLLKVMVAK